MRGERDDAVFNLLAVLFLIETVAMLWMAYCIEYARP